MPAPLQGVRVRALAKINLHLAIHERRADGFHALTTVFQAIALHDTIEVERQDGPFTLACAEPGVPTDQTNLVWRAAEAYREVLGRPALAGLRVTIDKDVPAQSGLGGGSADAIAMLRALAAMWGETLDDDRLAAIGRRLGSDVPFFAVGGTALGTGRGDELTPLPDLPAHALLIVRPSFGVGTADAYRWVAELRALAAGDGDGIESHPRFDATDWPRTSAEWVERLARCANDFEPVVSARFPVIADLTGRLRAQGAALALLSGSGSAVVGLFAEQGDADAARMALSDRPEWRCWLTRTVSRDECHARVAPLALTPYADPA
jgi:4-diphosphocytidyl-2-C-methyl-D-erythritol kinase